MSDKFRGYVSDPDDWTIRLFHSVGERKTGAKTKRKGYKQKCVTIYFAIEKDWTSRNLSRNGNTQQCLAMAKPTQAARDYRDMSHRATSLSYNGLGKQNAQGMADDLRSLEFDEETIQSFVKAAEPHFPIELKML